MAFKTASTIVLHDYFEQIEGGGQLSRCLAEQLPADLAYGFACLPRPLLRGGKEWDLQQFSAIPLWRQFKLARAFAQQTAFLNEYDTVIYSGFYTPLAVHQRKKYGNVLYCHTPPRFIYDQKAFYQQRLPWLLRPLLNAFITYLQPRYESAVKQMQLVIANSQHVRARIQHYLGCDAAVIYPPCDMQQFRWLEQGNYYLSTARLDPLKRVDQLVRAFLELPDRQLVVASGGSELARLKKLAQGASHIHFTGWLSATQLADVVGRAMATLYVPYAEDFGMSPVESMSAGKPVIGVAEGGLLETVIHGETGLLLPPNFDLSQLQAAILALTPSRALTMRHACERRAQQFSTSRFIAEMRQQLSLLEK
ncbi:glycosyl transferase family 1 [Thioflexithrix psekupsensis]|uniref:Glycosyl transferase family 1 n=2 Tax=Thioflexithrix psekupsensis TaxID=1570016 RepID=A0A251X6F8_9GAMM|nr:glycosyl transferase family 1 [Thioflexithrix psekupsensis]